jgi:hypothetical protein
VLGLPGETSGEEGERRAADPTLAAAHAAASPDLHLRRRRRAIGNRGLQIPERHFLAPADHGVVFDEAQEAERRRVDGIESSSKSLKMPQTSQARP